MKSDEAAHVALIERFYNAFSRRDPDGMLACYHRGVMFSDPVFPSLDALGAASMWRMLCARGKDLVVGVSDIRADASTGSARWVATYTFSATGRKVANRIAAAFDFRDALIVRHVDRFSLWRWAAIALGPKGALLGWCLPVRAAIRAQAAKSLAAFAGAQV
ncbi:MAG: nuclear transport factor 2 family protein [Betaproteobacteria bacterium]|nr:MAG: nuclear transport factor 2 family protein [Betaproteobacteria bacterium]